MTVRITTSGKESGGWGGASLQLCSKSQTPAAPTPPGSILTCVRLGEPEAPDPPSQKLNINKISKRFMYRLKFEKSFPRQFQLATLTEFLLDTMVVFTRI